MYTSARKEKFNLAYVQALAAQVGINSAEPIVDNDSIDIMFIGRDFSGLIRDPQINVQLKCTHQNFRNGENIRFPLPRKNYDDLRDVRVGAPRYLAILEVPESPTEWAVHFNDGTILQSKCFWVSIRGLPEVDQDTITVSVPLNQRLTGESLHNLLKQASDLVIA
ncbi:DUF4365 domain-containing protein [Ectopseudomonas guguanensis]|jgi:hypothetical protein|uniref:DUF4365 domain-containing protein n=1 Tax=Ectopseudomonas guguanensis TaxID=1198456 RepID=UPI002854F155|nr:DUF4365 domain-containing protein [Pseudomonas guguanensis]MDR8017158.1 DUF4365 domain-containing protein [Pseudomonas guguanensis]